MSLDQVRVINLAEYRELNAKMIGWALSYYKLGRPDITDGEWDIHYRTLQLFETTHPAEVLENSVVGKVGYAMFGETGTVSHNPPMLSLSNRLTIVEACTSIEKFLQKDKATLVAQYKADGNACRITYHNGKPVSAATRGDGIYGENIDNIIAGGCKGIPVNGGGSFTVDGEVVIQWNDFELLNAEREKAGKLRFKNPRNAVAGILTSKDPAPYELKSLTFLAFAYNSETKHFSNYYEELEELFNLMFIVIKTEKIGDVKDFVKLEAKIAAERDDLDYMIDGIVIKIVETPIRNALGESSDSPNWAFSYKFVAEQKWSTVTNTGFTVGRTGQITGMLYFEPVELGGVTVVKSAVDSYDRWLNMSPGIGSEVLVSRRADVRPYVEDVRPTALTVVQPFSVTCPECNHTLSKRGRKVYCTSDSCRGIAIAGMDYAFGKEILNVDNFSTATSELLYDLGYHHFTEIFMTTKERLIEKGIAAPMAGRIIDTVHAARITDMWRIIASLGVQLIGRTLGRSIADSIASNYGNDIESLKKVLSDATLINALPIGPAAKINLVAAMVRPNIMLAMANLDKCGFVLRSVGKLTGKRYCITGSFTGNMKRAVMAQKLNALGAIVQDSVTAETTTLITDDPVDILTASTKMKKAIKLGIPIITSAQAIEFIAGL